MGVAHDRRPTNDALCDGNTERCPPSPSSSAKTWCKLRRFAVRFNAAAEMTSAGDACFASSFKEFLTNSGFSSSDSEMAATTQGCRLLFARPLLGRFLKWLPRELALFLSLPSLLSSAPSSERRSSMMSLRKTATSMLRADPCNFCRPQTTRSTGSCWSSLESSKLKIAAMLPVGSAMPALLKSIRFCTWEKNAANSSFFNIPGVSRLALLMRCVSSSPFLVCSSSSSKTLVVSCDLWADSMNMAVTTLRTQKIENATYAENVKHNVVSKGSSGPAASDQSMPPEIDWNNVYKVRISEP
mmetsp:Transcript_21864/g.61088  ORF Transcript_21864/g.61088 Transcript_21864/m.61088 type:complete len:299 (+) Transcript_21864:90-986(+)